MLIRIILLIFISKEFQAFDTRIEKVPYQASIRYRSAHVCGGSIITERLILSAAHCFNRGLFLNVNNYDVLVGSSFWRTGGTIYEMMEVIRHPKYGFWDQSYDFALVKTLKFIEISQSVRTVGVPEREENTEGGLALVSGWSGIKFDNGTFYIPEQLQAANLTILSNSKCSQTWRIELTGKNINICGTVSDKNFGKVEGGAPLVINGTIIGVATKDAYPKSNQCSDEKPCMFSRVSNISSWIKDLLTGRFNKPSEEELIIENELLKSKVKASVSFELVKAIDTENMTQAVKLIADHRKTVPRDDSFLTDVVSSAYSVIKDKKIVKMLKFVDAVSSDDEKVKCYTLLLDKMKANQDLIVPNIFDFLLSIHKANASTESTKSSLSSLKDNFYIEVARWSTELANSVALDGSKNFTEIVTRMNADKDEVFNRQLEILALNLFKTMPNYEEALKFIKKLEHKKHKFIGLNAIFNNLRNSTIPPELPMIAYQIRAAMIGETGALLNSFESLKNLLPPSLIAIIWNPMVSLRNTQYNDSMYSPDGENYDRNSTYVFNAASGRSMGTKEYWRFETSDEGRTFDILSESSKQYLFSANDKLAYDKDRRRVFTWRSGGKVPEGKWIIGILNGQEISIKSQFYNEYLLASKFKFDVARRYVFTWRPGTFDGDCIWKVIAI